ncbi:MAG: polyphosphate kinase 1 [Actinomycetota bacterium]
MAAVRSSAGKKRTTAAADRLINRELSFLDYDARVLALARDPELPLLERVRFVSIFSLMLDEFFMVRIAGLASQAAAGVTVRSPDGRTAPQTIVAARAQVLELQAEQARIWAKELCPALAAEGIVLSRVDDLPEAAKHELAHRFEHDIYPILTPLAVGPGQPFPYISGLSVSLAVFVRDPETGETRFARVKVPEGLPRFVALADGTHFVTLEQTLRHFLPALFPGMEVVESSLFRVTRDADLEVSDEADDLLEAVEQELRRRRFGEITRVEVSQAISSAMRTRIQRGLRVADDLIYPVDGTLDLADVDELTDLDRPDLKVDHWIPVPRPPLAGVDGQEQFDMIRRGDLLVHHPYDSFTASFEAWMNNAADDPDVIALKSTVYRTSDESPLVPALIAASESGKQSVCLVELKARGDERRNIEWSRALEQAGVHVVYGFSNMKTHVKATLVVRREGDELRRYVHLGTGNYNKSTAKAYEDFGLFSCDPDITADIADLFNYLTGFGRPAHFRKLLVAPFTLQSRLIDEIRAVADAATQGKKARIRIKVNGLTQPAIIDELYGAAEAGAKIELLVRGVCSLRPRDNIRVRSVLGRFLEHSRVFQFEAGDETRFYIGSADLMPRNLEHRVEVLAPISDPPAQSELAWTLDALFADTAASWELDAAGVWQRVHPKKGDRPRSAQAVLMRRARRRVSLARSRA